MAAKSQKRSERAGEGPAEEGSSESRHEHGQAGREEGEREEQPEAFRDDARHEERAPRQADAHRGVHGHQRAVAPAGVEHLWVGVEGRRPEARPETHERRAQHDGGQGAARGQEVAPRERGLGERHGGEAQGEHMSQIEDAAHRPAADRSQGGQGHLGEEDRAVLGVAEAVAAAQHRAARREAHHDHALDEPGQIDEGHRAGLGPAGSPGGVRHGRASIPRAFRAKS